MPTATPGPREHTLLIKTTRKLTNPQREGVHHTVSSVQSSGDGNLTAFTFKYCDAFFETPILLPRHDLCISLGLTYNIPNIRSFIK